MLKAKSEKAKEQKYKNKVQTAKNDMLLTILTVSPLKSEPGFQLYHIVPFLLILGIFFPFLDNRGSKNKKTATIIYIFNSNQSVSNSISIKAKMVFSLPENKNKASEITKFWAQDITPHYNNDYWLTSQEVSP